MQDLWKLVSSPRHLMVFEAAARHQSFTRAAEELHTHQPAVSTAIKQLEQSLGVVLFIREHRKVALTSAGARLHSDVTRSLEQILLSARSVQQLTVADHVTLNSSSAFSHYWLMPRLVELHARHPDIDLRIQSSDREPDIDAENISLAVRRGNGDWLGCHAALIADEAIYPVASPQVMSKVQDVHGRPNLEKQPLIHLEEPVRDRPGWRQWFEHFDYTTRPPDNGLILNDYALVLQAAIAGEGIAFGWWHVTDRLIRQGVLAARKDWTWKTGLGFYLVWSKKHELTGAAAQTRDWILETCRSEPGQSQP
ncbi:LysR substrate-binding domain-containing protein [Granulosicoccus sp. 3-233]|uniref:LysR substrate-binding domain-containing protein n=1 Tax=Granulosicoccus sp. 3-233 TaxID=3417969 RepID=UPI003D328B56